MERMRKAKRQKATIRAEIKELATAARKGNPEAEKRLRRLLVPKRNQRVAKEILADTAKFKKIGPKFGNAFKPFQGGAPGLGKKS